MKDTVLYALNGVLLVAVIVLFFLVLKPSDKKTTTPVAAKAGIELKESGLIAYVDLDSLEQNYILFKEKKAELQKKQSNIENTLQQRVAAFQKEVYELQQRAPMMTQSEGEAAQEKMYKKQAELEEMRDRMGKSFMDDQEAFNKQLQDKLDSFLAVYNADKKYNFIFSHIKGGPLLYHDEAFNITNDVVNGMNDALPKKDK
jgi:outer membrane protein